MVTGAVKPHGVIHRHVFNNWKTKSSLRLPPIPSPHFLRHSLLVTGVIMSTAASPAPSEGESKRGEVAYRFCQDWLVRPSHLDLRNSLTRFAVQISCIPKRIERLHNSYSYAKRATRPKCSITLAPTAINSVLPSRKLPVSRQMLRMIQLCVMTLLCCPCFCTMCGDQIRCGGCGEPALEESDVSDIPSQAGDGRDQS